MTNSEKQKVVGELLSTAEGRKRLIGSISMPLRCGGCNYIDGKYYYMHNGKYYLETEWRKFADRYKSNWIEPKASFI